MQALFDVNVLIALHDREHVHHALAAQWLESNIEHGWASCPLTQNGCLRMMSQPGYSNPLPLGLLSTGCGWLIPPSVPAAAAILSGWKPG